MNRGNSFRVALITAVLALALVAASCTSSSTTDTAATGGTPTDTVLTTTAAEHPSAILVQPIHDAQIVPGDDGKDHVEYELLVVNVYFDPVTLTSLTVLDPAGKEIGRITGATLAAATQALLTRTPTPAIDPSAAVAVDVDLAVEPGTAPERVTHRIDYTVTDPKRAVIIDIGDTVVNGPEVAIDRRAPVVIAPPLAGDGLGRLERVLQPECPPGYPTGDQRRPHRDPRNVRDRLGTGQERPDLRRRWVAERTALRLRR